MSVGKDSLHFLEGSQIMWTREEALSRVQNTLFLDLPASTAEAEAQLKERRPTLTDRVNAEVLTIKVGCGCAAAVWQTAFRQSRASTACYALRCYDLVLKPGELGCLFALSLYCLAKMLWALTAQQRLKSTEGKKRHK